MPPHTDHPDGVRAVLITTSVIELPIDIKTCTATLKVDITAQTVGKIGISIAATDITGNIPIDINAQTLGTVAIAINATDITGNIPIDINAQTVGNIGISINAGDVTGNIAIDIKAASVGNLTMEITAQTVGIYLKGDWESKAGHGKSYNTYATDVPFGNMKSSIYAIPGDKAFYAYTFVASCHAHRDAEADFNQFCRGYVRIGAAVAFNVGGNGGFVVPINPPLKVAGGTNLTISITPFANHKCDITADVIGYEA